MRDFLILPKTCPEKMNIAVRTRSKGGLERTEIIANVTQIISVSDGGKVSREILSEAAIDLSIHLARSPDDLEPELMILGVVATVLKSIGLEVEEAQ